MPDIKLLNKKNYLSMVENSVKGENHLFRNKYATMDGKEIDILDNGKLSCAILVSSILYLNKMIGDLHTTVSGLEADLKKSGWSEINKLKEGAIVVWEKQTTSDGSSHSHAGFYVGNNEAISNSSNNSGFPVKHNITYNNTRKIERIYWHPALNEDLQN